MKYPLEIFKALSEETRFRIIHILLNSKNEICECDLSVILDVPQYNISRHLNILDSAGLINKRREGRWIYLSITNPLDELKSNVLNSFSFLPKELTIKDLEKLEDIILSQNGTKCL